METHHASKIMTWFQACWKALLSAKEENFNQEKNIQQGDEKGQEAYPSCLYVVADDISRQPLPARGTNESLSIVIQRYCIIMQLL